MDILWPFILSFIAGLSTLLGCIFIFIKINKKDEFITFCISFSLAVMIMISIFDLIPSALKNITSSYIKNILLIILFFIIGILLVFIINKLIEKARVNSNSLYKLGILNFIALVLHNLPEGILTFMSTYHDFKLGLSLCAAIALHNIPEGISIAVPIYYSTKSKWKAVKTTLLSAVAEPLGALLAFLFLKNIITDEIINLFLVLVAGIMITLSIEKMFPEALKYKKNSYIIKGIIAGFIIVILSLIII